MRLRQIIEFFDRRKIQLVKAWQDVTASLWFRPSVWMAFSVTMATILVAVDNRVLVDDFWSWAPWFLLGNADGARTMLGSISSATLTVTSLAFSLMMVAVVQTASSYSPRIIGQFISDQHNQNVLGILLGTFLYSLLVLRAVNDDFVPLLAVNVALIFAVISTIALISFISHVAQSLKVSEISEVILTHAVRVIQSNFPGQIGRDWVETAVPPPPNPGARILAKTSGYLQLLDGEELLQIAREADVVIELYHSLGDHVLGDAPIAKVWPADAVDDSLRRSIRSTLAIGRERTDTQDVRFGIRQLVDIALRALSPGVNDPTTATDMINALKRILAAKIKEKPASHMRADEDGALRLILPLQTLEMLLDESFLEILHYGRSDFAAMRQLIDALAQLRHLTIKTADQRALCDMLELVRHTAETHIESEAERRRLNVALEKAAAVFESNALAIDEAV